MEHTAQIPLGKTIAMVFGSTGLFTALYLAAGILFPQLPTLLIFCLLGILFLFPIEWVLLLRQSKKDYGNYSLASALTHQEKQPVPKILLLGFLLFGIAGICAFTIQPLETMLFSSLREKLLSLLPLGFDWTNIDYIKSFPNGIVTATCAVYVVLNVFVGPITEEFFFRGYLTAHTNRYGNWTPVLITALFSLYHFWLPFQNLFRMAAFLPMAYMAYRQKNLYICMAAHMMCNLFSSISFVVAVMG